MALENFFFYDEKSCSFEPVRYPALERIVYTACLWLLCGVVVSGIGIIALSYIAGTPSEIALQAENRELLIQLEKTRASIGELDNAVQRLSRADNEIYRTILGMEPVAADQRALGVGGSDEYNMNEDVSLSTARTLERTTTLLEDLERRIGVQKISFEQIKDHYNKNQRKLTHLPAIRPVKGDVISSYGMRLHPVYRFYRMHKGLDFKAKDGEPVYATGDGVVAWARHRGTMGLLIVVEHGFGFQSRYAHLSKLEPGVSAGRKVKRGQLIGYSGRSGVVEGPHLHYEIIKDGKAVDPINYLFADLSPEEYNQFLRVSKANPNSMD
jgi:murein DD-endopeptidase MepM/ murein hydrolase activator NlpD